MVLLGVYVAKLWSWLVREIQFLAGCRPPHNCQGKCPLSFGILFVGAQSLYLELRTKNPRQEFARVRLHGLFASLRSNSSLVAMALKRTNFKDSGNIYMLVQPKTPSRWNFFKTEIEMLPAFICLFTLGNLFVFDYLRIHTKSSYFQHTQILKKIKEMILWTSGTVLYSSSL